MDIASTTAPRSDQQNFDDYAIGPRTVTIAEVREGTSEQPVEIHLVEFPGRPYKPSKSMRRVLLSAWGKDSTAYAGRRLTLYGDPDVTFGRDKVGGIKISHLSDISGPLEVRLTVTRGKRSPFVVEPLVDTRPTAAQIEAMDDLDALRGLWEQADPATRTAIEARVAVLRADPTTGEIPDTAS